MERREEGREGKKLIKERKREREGRREYLYCNCPY